MLLQFFRTELSGKALRIAAERIEPRLSCGGSGAINQKSSQALAMIYSRKSV